MAYISLQDKKDLAPGIKAVLKKYGMKGTISIRHHMTLAVTVQSGAIDLEPFFRKDKALVPSRHIDVNVYHLEWYSGTLRMILEDLVKAMIGTKWYDKSDAMVDYFDTAYYIDINLGKWDKDYVFTGAKEAA